MTNHWAIAVGINQYQSLQPLNFAQQDAQSLCEGLVSEAGFLPERCILMTDSSPEVVGRSTYPSRDNLQHWVRFFRQELAHPGDWIWVFFSGYGVCSQGQDYLLPIEGDPRNAAATGVTVRSLYEQLKGLPTDRLLVLLDINRASASISDEKLGIQTAELAREFQIPTILSCRPEEYSHEAPVLGHGLFTAALLEGLRSHQCSTLGSLEDFLATRLPELCEHNNHPVQHPVLLVADLEQVHQVITPVNWAETDEWMPVAETSNPFAIEGDFFDASVLDVEPAAEVGELRFDPPETKTFEPVSFPSDAEVTSVSPSSLPLTSEPILELDTQGDPVYVSPTASTAGAASGAAPTGTTQNPEAAAEEVPDRVFWRRLLVGGSTLLALLLAGVLIRNWSAFTGQQTAKNSPPATAAPLKAEQQAKPQPSPAKAGVQATKASPQARSSQSLLTEARSLTKPSSASDANKAIELARRIPQTDPLYPQAQEDIERWSRNILDIARQRAKQGQLRQAIAAAQLVPKDRPQVYAEAQKAIAQWRKTR